MTAVPRVSFVVPCYRLAHLVGDCIQSILDQTEQNLEVLVMDDCSPDNVAAVVDAFRDPRVRHVRHDTNLGHLRNYNRGIELARGEFVWLISADDRLRLPEAVERLVGMLERHPRAGFAFSPAERCGNGTNGHLYGSHGPRDAVFPAEDFACEMVVGNAVPAPAAVVRAACYREGLRFPLDLPFVGDWYIWGRLALSHDVAYVAEPLAYYRVHAANMTKHFHANPAALVADEVAVRWKLRADALRLGHLRVAATALRAIGDDYALRVGRHVTDQWPFGLSMADCAASIAMHGAPAPVASALLARAAEAYADAWYELGDRDQARQWYGRACRRSVPSASTVAKRALLSCGPAGDAARRLLSAAKIALGTGKAS